MLKTCFFALQLWRMECRLMWKSHLKQFSIRQQHNKMWKKEGYFCKALYLSIYLSVCLSEQYEIQINKDFKMNMK